MACVANSIYRLLHESGFSDASEDLLGILLWEDRCVTYTYIKIDDNGAGDIKKAAKKDDGICERSLMTN